MTCWSATILCSVANLLHVDLVMMVVEEEVLLALRLSILQLKEALHEGTDAREMPLSRPSVGSQSRNPFKRERIIMCNIFKKVINLMPNVVKRYVKIYLIPCKKSGF